MGKLLSITKKFFAEVLLDDLARGRIDIKGLSPHMRRFVISCIAVLCTILACTIILYFYDNLFPAVSFSYFDIPYNISYITLTISAIAFIIGWTFLLTGGIWSNIAVFSIISLFFIFLTGYIGLDVSHPWWILVPLGFITILLIPSMGHSTQGRPILRYIILFIFCLRLGYLYIFATPIDHHLPSNYIWAFIIGLAILLAVIIFFLKKCQIQEKIFIPTGIAIIFLTIFLRNTFQISRFTETLFTVFSQITTYISLFWFILGFSALWGVVNLAEWARDAIEILFPRFKISWILSLFQLTIFVLLLKHAYYAIHIETALEKEFHLGSLIIFVIGLTWLLFQGSGLIINSSGRWFPRNSRLYLFFGLIFLMLGLNHLMLIARSRDFMNIVKISAYTGFLYTGPPFILYRWLVKRLKRHPVNPSQLAFLFIWGAILIHPALVLQKALLIYKTHLLLFVIIISIIQEYLKLIIIRKITYRSSSFNELIDGIIYAVAFGLGWLIFALNPQFNLLPLQIRFVQDIQPTLYKSAFLCYLFSLQFATGGLLGYGLAKTKLSGRVKPLFIGFLLAVLYRAIGDITILTNIKFIWGLTAISLLVVIVTIRKALKVLPTG